MVDLGDIKKKGEKMADKTKEAAHKAEHRAEEAGEKAKDTVKRQTRRAEFVFSTMPACSIADSSTLLLLHSTNARIARLPSAARRCRRRVLVLVADTCSVRSLAC
ncbi:MAG: hypothetical protein ACXVIA_07210 [Halobacteriota archaeon]